MIERKIMELAHAIPSGERNWLNENDGGVSGSQIQNGIASSVEESNYDMAKLIIYHGKSLRTSKRNR